MPGLVRFGIRSAVLLITFTTTVAGLAQTRSVIDLTGTWDFYPDVGEATLERVTKKPGRIVVPGAWQAQGYGEPGGTIPSANIGPGTSPAEYLRHNLMGRCLYVRTVGVPADWHGRRIFLCVRRAYRYTDATVNGKRIGAYEGFCSPFEFDVTDSISVGTNNQVILGVDNRPRPGRDTLGTANLYGNWGGLGGAVFLEARPTVRIADVFAMPQIGAARVVMRIKVESAGAGIPTGLTLLADVTPWDRRQVGGGVVGRGSGDVSASASNQAGLELPVALAPLRLWTPDDPFLYVGHVKLLAGEQTVDELTVRFGMREITADGNKLLVNGQPLYLSGYGDDATEPITGMLPADKRVYRQRLSLMRSLGFNFVRHHSCVPHDEYFEAADEVGMLVQPEAGLAYTGFWRTGHQLFEQEWRPIIQAFRNHPSIWAWCMGNELFLNELPDESNSSVDLSRPIAQGPLSTIADEDNGVFGPPGKFPTQGFKQSNYFRDVSAWVDGTERTLMGDAQTSRVFTDAPHELGLKFTSAQDGQIRSIRYFRVPQEMGAHLGRLWDAQGRELARVEFTNETNSGWQTAVLPDPVPIHTNQRYVVSVNANRAYGAMAARAEGISRQQVLEIVERAYRQAKELDPTRLVHASDGGTPHPFTDILSSGRADGSTKPFLLHEYGTYCCSLPDFSLIPRLGGVIRPLTYERAERYVREHQFGSVYPKLHRSSLMMRAEAQKHYMESAKSSRNNCGYSFWLGVDFPDSPEGCWDEGILNQLWEPKPYLTNDLPDLNGSIVLLTSAGLETRSFYSDQTKRVGIKLWHYGPKPIEEARLTWRVQEGNQTLQRGEVHPIASSLGETKTVAELDLTPEPSSVPRFLDLEVELWHGGRRLARNSWEFFAYPRPLHREPLPGIYSDAGPLPGATELNDQQLVPENVRLLITRELKRGRHRYLFERGRAAVLLLGTGGFKETRAGYFLNSHGTGFGGIIETHPVFDEIPHEGRLHLGLYQLIAGGGLLETESMPRALRDGSVVWGLRLTGWISPIKNLRKVTHFCEVQTDNQLHLVLCNLDLLADKPESRYVLSRAIDYLISDQISPLARACTSKDLEGMLR